MVLQALGEHGLYSAGDLRDQGRVRRVGRGGLERVPDLDHPPVDDLHEVNQQAQQAGDREHDDEAHDDHAHPERVFCRCHGQVVHRYPPSRARPRCSPPMMIVACSIVVRRPPSAAVLCTALVSSALIEGASLPIERASMRIGTTSATTTRTIKPPITYPRVQPNVLVALPAASTRA